MLERIDSRAKVARYSFDSLREVGVYLDKQAIWTIDASRQKHSENNRWTMGASFEDAQRMAKQGWIEGAQKVQKALKVFRPSTPRPTKKHGVYGSRVNPARYAADNPRCMVRNAISETGNGRVLSLYVPIGMSSATDPIRAMNFGVAVVQYVRQLEATGTRVELHCGYACDGVHGWDMAYTVRLKRADQPLDLAVVAFAIGHPAMFRRIVFALMERSTVPQSSAYGYPNPMKEADIINPAPGAFILNGMTEANTHARTPESALEYVSKQIEAAMAAK